jgi:hypothetical protein
MSENIWGRGAGILTSARRRRAVNSSSPNGGDKGDDGNSGGNLFPPNNDIDVEFGVDDNDNPFESIGRELDHSVGGDATTRVVEGMKSSSDEADAAVDAKCLSRQSGIVGLISEKNYGVIDTVKTNGGVNSIELANKTENGTMFMPQEDDLYFHNSDKYSIAHEETNNSSPPGDVCTNDNPTSENVNQGLHVSNTAKHSSSLANSVMKKISPTRFTFQSSSDRSSSISSTRPKNFNSFKTPANNKSLPSRELFSSSGAMTRRSNVVNETTQNSNIHKSTVKRHTFRRSMDNSSAVANNTPTVVNNNVREMGFVPTFLSHSKGRSGGTLDVPENGDDDDCDDYNSNNLPKREGALPSSYNMITEHHRQQQQQQQHKSHRHAKLGPLVQRMHALRNSNQRMAMRLRSGQLAATPPGGGSSGSSFLASRKRRRSGGGGEHLDPTSMLDVTVSCASLSLFDTTLANCGILLAYIHARTEIKGSSSSSGQFAGRFNLPCYARLIMSRDVIHERGIVNDCINKQLRLYDALVIPARLMMTENPKVRGGSSSDDVDCYQNNMMKNMPTIICANICQDYPTDKPTLQDVSFQLHNP